MAESMILKSARRRLARRVRRVMNAPHTPLWAVSCLRRLAHYIHPHVLRCRVCGAEFTATDWWSVAHADRAFDHYVIAHEPNNAREPHRG